MDQNFATSPSVIEVTIAIVCLKKCRVIHNYNKDGASGHRRQPFKEPYNISPI